MSVIIVSQTGNELALEVKIDLSGSMCEIEEKIVSICNEVGTLGTEIALSGFDTDGSPILIGGNKYTSRAKDHKAYQTPYGVAHVRRHVYQDSSGGKVYVPLESTARILHGATPKFAKMLSHKYASMSAQEVLDDLSMNHGRAVSKKYLQRVSESVFSIVQSKRDDWAYELPCFDKSIEVVSISLDGAMLPTCETGWRESMVGTISLYDKEGERKHSIYIGEAPEYGKNSFMQRLEKEILKIKRIFPNCLYVGIADGAKNNWPILEKHTDQQLLDFYHVTEYLTKVSYAAHPEKTGKPARMIWLKERCHQLKHVREAAKNMLEEFKKFERKKKLTREIRENLTATITYFRNHISLMNYAEHVEKELPIGSGVTEAACKTLIKQRFCRSGMRWKEQGIKVVLGLRELVQTTGRWQQFWGKIAQCGLPCAA